MKIYTRTGDDGTTSLSGGRRVPKHSIRVEAFGSVDELIAWISLLRDLTENLKRRELLLYVERQLMACSAALASDGDKVKIRKLYPEDKCVTVIEKEIDLMEESLPPLENFVLPGGNTIVSYCHIARCVCRRAERAVTMLNETENSPEIVNKFLNRLSDYLFVLSRKICLELDIEEIKWSV